VVTHQLQVERSTAKAHRPKTDALPLDHVDGQVRFRGGAEGGEIRRRCGRRP